MSPQTIESTANASDGTLEPAGAVPMAIPSADFVAEPEATTPSAPGTPPMRAPHKMVAGLWLRLPLLVRLAGGVGLWAFVYHYRLPVATWFTLVFLGVVGVGIAFVGLLFNTLL